MSEQVVSAFRRLSSRGVALPSPGGQPEVVILTITPELARSWLANQTRNRPPSRVNVDKIKQDVIAGRFALNGTTIKINREGRMFDGQHRCMAIAEAGIAVTAMVAFNVEEGAVDIGRVRTAGDQLNIDGGQNGRKRCAVALSLIGLREGTLSHQFVASATRVLEVAKAEGEAIEEACARLTIHGFGKSKVAPANVVAASMHIRPLDPAKLDAFCSRVSTGVGLREDDPAFHCRSGLAGMSGRFNTRSRIEAVLKFLKAAEVEISGKPMRVLRADPASFDRLHARVQELARRGVRR